MRAGIGSSVGRGARAGSVPVPTWAKSVVAPKSLARPVAVPSPTAAPTARAAGYAADAPAHSAPATDDAPVGNEREDEGGFENSARKAKYERPARTGREPGMVPIVLNVGRKQLVTPADIVGKIAGVTRLPATVVGAIDIHQRHTLADVAETEADFIVKKLAGIKLKGIALEPMRAGDETKSE